MLTNAGWHLLDESDKNIKANVDLEYSTKINRDDRFKAGLLDYLLLDSKGFPLCVLEAKREDINPLSAKKQAREYAEAQGIRFVILSNGNIHYLWHKPIYDWFNANYIYAESENNPNNLSIEELERILDEEFEFASSKTKRNIIDILLEEAPYWINRDLYLNKLTKV